jgi:hypothetical protein
MTVSRVVRGERTVKLATVAKVQHFLRNLDYHPDPMLSALAAYRMRSQARATGSTLAFIETEKLPYNRLLLEGAHAEAARLGYAVEVFSLPSTPSGQHQLNRRLFHCGIRGLMLSPSNRPYHLAEWDWNQFAPVSMGSLGHEPPMHAVAMDYFQGLQTAYAELQKMGHRRIGLLMQEGLEARTNHLWLGAYLTLARPALRPLLFTQAPRSGKFLDPWLQRECPDAILTIHRDWHKRLARIGVATAYLNDVDPHPGSPHLRLDARHIGRESVQLVHLLLLRQEFGLPSLSKMILLRAEWNQGMC